MPPEQSTSARRRLRRIPDTLRKRGSQSCDLCRNKRCRCIPTPSGKGCVACQTHNVPCSYTLPRKTRFYGSLDDLSDRYKCLEAVVRGAFPNDPISTAADLMQLGQRVGYDMPDLSRRTGAPAKLEDLVRTTPSSEAGRSSSTDRASQERSGPDLPGPTAADSVPILVDSGTSASEEPLGLIRDTSGREHYIGPSGSLQFLGQLRRLLSVTEREPGDVNTSPSSKFTEDDTAQALEANGNIGDSTDPATDQHAQVLSQDGLSPGSVNSSIAKDFTRQPFENVEELLRPLPPQPRVDDLLHSYFKNVHEDFPLFHRGTFEEEYESHFVRLHRPSTRRDVLNSTPPDYGWIGCLHMMLVFGSISDAKIAGIDHVALRRHCVAVTRNLLPQLVSKCTLSGVRALLLLSLFLHNNNERNAAWNLVGTATRICFALGLHRSDTATSFRPIERELRKRVFCTLYCFEQFLASSLGRPSGLNDLDVQITPPREVLLGSGQDGDGDILPLSLRLQKMLSTAGLSPSASTEDELERHRHSAGVILASLKSWKLEVAKHRGLDIPSITEKGDPSQWASSPGLDFEQLKTMLGWQNHTRIRATMLLHLQYRYIAVLVTRPFLLRSIASGRINPEVTTTTSRDDIHLSNLCVEHACQLSRIVFLLDSHNLLNGISGLDVFYAYCAAMVLILRCLKKQSDADNPGDDAVQEETSLLTLLRGLVTRLRDAVVRVDKSGTMRRFARVMAMFDESVHRERPQKPRPPIPHNYSHALHDNHMVFSRTPIPNGSAIDPQLQAQQPILPHQGLGALGTQTDMWPQNDLTSFDAMPDLNTWLGPFLGSGNDASMLEWGDIETMLQSYGQPP